MAPDLSGDMEPGSGSVGGACCGSQRAQLLLLLCTCNAVLYINRANMSIAMTFMYAESATAERAQALAAFYYGYPLLQLVSSHWALRFGGKKVLLVASIVWSLATLLLIPAFELGDWAVCLARAVVGAAEGMGYPSQLALMSTWIPLQERSRAFSFLDSGESIGTLVAMPGCAFLAHAFGWRVAFAAPALLGFAWAGAFALLACRSPEESSKVSSAELAHIRSGRGGLEPQGSSGWRSVPWRRLITSPALLAILVPHFCFNWGYYLCLNVLPDFFQTTFQSHYAEMGIFALLPYAAIIVVGNGSGWLADRLLLQRWGWSLRSVRKFSTAVAMGGTCVFFLLLRRAESKGWAVFFTVGAVGIGGVADSGFQVNFLDISPRFAPSLFGVSNTIASLPGILGVWSLAWFDGDFASVFAFAGLLQLLGALVYVMLGRAEDQRFEEGAARAACVDASPLAGRATAQDSRL